MEAVKCEAFLAAAELGSLTATAKLLGYTQSGVTRMIGTLEEELGFPLMRLQNEPFIHTSPNHDTDQDRLLEQHDLHPQTCFTTRDGFTTYNMVEAGLGVSFNQRLISRKWSGTVAEVPFDPPQFVTLGISVPSLKEASPAAKKFIACAIETVTGGEKSL